MVIGIDIVPDTGFLPPPLFDVRWVPCSPPLPAPVLLDGCSGCPNCCDQPLIIGLDPIPTASDGTSQIKHKMRGY